MAALLGGCATQQGLAPTTPDGFLREHGLIDRPKPGAFSFCLDYGCARREVVSLSASAWEKIMAPLAEKAANPADERQAIAAAVGLFEKAARGRLGLPIDRAGTYPAAFVRDQNDCVDETANTTTLLVMLNAAGALKHHRVGRPARRGVFVDIALPHRSATIAERKNGKAFVVDSWFRDSGGPADVAPLGKWLAGWTPPGGAWS